MNARPPPWNWSSGARSSTVRRREVQAGGVERLRGWPRSARHAPSASLTLAHRDVQADSERRTGNRGARRSAVRWARRPQVDGVRAVPRRSRSLGAVAAGGSGCRSPRPRAPARPGRAGTGRSASCASGSRSCRAVGDRQLQGLEADRAADGWTSSARAARSAGDHSAAVGSCSMRNGGRSGPSSRGAESRQRTIDRRAVDVRRAIGSARPAPPSFRRATSPSMSSVATAQVASPPPASSARTVGAPIHDRSASARSKTPINSR